MLISAAILKKPQKENGQIVKGAVITSACDIVCEVIPDTKKYFYVIERRGWYGLNDSKLADIKLVEDLFLWDQTRELFPNAICLDIGPADFVDTDAFKPLGLTKDYDVIQVSRWDEFKRSDMFVKAAGFLPHRKFLKLGHFSENGTPEEFEIRNRDMHLAKELGANIDFPHADALKNDAFPKTKEAVNQYINRARVGILTTKAEGINRFKMECLSAGVPVLVPADTSYPTKKHINEETGGFFEPTPEALAGKIEEVLGNIGKFSPRAYVERTTGKNIALKKLKGALKEVSERENHPYIFDDIDWDGRNESLKWGSKAINEIKRVIKEVDG